MLRIDKVSKHFAGKRKGDVIIAVDDVSIQLGENDIFALIGESGSGKSTLAEMVIGLQEPTSGSIGWEEQTVQSEQSSRSAQSMQIVFQNPDRSMNPYWRVGEIIAEPLRLSGYSKQQARKQAEALLEKVKLTSDFMQRYPAECSGGQKQRIAIARALTMSPRLLVADEITSALDPAIEEEILQLLLMLKRSEGMSILYITHRIETISGFADRVAVMKNGVIMEIGPAENVFADPQSDYTKALLKAAFY